MNVKGSIPANTTVTPSNQRVSFRRSFKVRSMASKQWRCWAEASFQMINEVFLNRAARSLWVDIGHMLSKWISMEIFNLKCDVRPPSRRIAAMSKEATERAMSPKERALARSKFSTKVLPVPSDSSMKNRPLFSSDWTTDVIKSRITFCSELAFRYPCCHLAFNSTLS